MDSLEIGAVIYPSPVFLYLIDSGKSSSQKRPGKWLMVDGQWSMGNGQWLMVDGQWLMVDGQWSMVDGQWSMVDVDYAAHNENMDSKHWRWIENLLQEFVAPPVHRQITSMIAHFLLH
ncbi:MAG: hypothetical protein WC130_07975 [Kiritimatiellia bacterium]|jgi:hypothetical protein